MRTTFRLHESAIWGLGFESACAGDCYVLEPGFCRPSGMKLLARYYMSNPTSHRNIVLSPGLRKALHIDSLSEQEAMR